MVTAVPVIVHTCVGCHEATHCADVAPELVDVDGGPLPLCAKCLRAYARHVDARTAALTGETNGRLDMAMDFLAGVVCFVETKRAVGAAVDAAEIMSTGRRALDKPRAWVVRPVLVHLASRLLEVLG